MKEYVERYALLALATALAALVFWIDSSPAYNFSISILYLLVLVLVSINGGEKRIKHAAQACIVLTACAWTIAHWRDMSVENAARALFVCVAIGVTAALMISRKRLEATKKELERSRAEAELFANSVPFVLWHSNPRGEIVYLNESWTRVTGLDRWSVLEGQRYNDVVHPDDMEALVETVTAAVTNRTLTDLKVRVRQADGSYRWMQIYDLPVLSPLTGEVERFGGLSDVHNEVTAKQELQQVRAELERSRQELVNFTDSVPQILWRADENGRVDFYNRRYTEITGRDHIETIERGNNLDGFHPDDREEFIRRRHKAVAERAELRMNYRLRQADGSYRWMSLVGRPVVSADGETVHWYGGTSDEHDQILARQELERLREELEASRKELVNFTDSVPQILFRASQRAEVDFFNRRFTEVTGRDLDAVMEKQDWIEDFHPDDRERYLANLRKSFGAGEELRDTFRLRHADGSYRWMSIVGRPIAISDGSNEIRYYGGVSDIHDEVTAHQKVRELNETLEQRVAERTSELMRTERRYAGLFDVSNITFAEMDFSAAEPILDEIKAGGTTDLRAYLQEHPEDLARALSAVRTTRVNAALARLMGYESVANLVANPPAANAEDGAEVLLRQLEMYFYGIDHIDGRTVLTGKGGRRIPVYFTVTRLPDGLHLSSHVDLSDQERTEALRRATEAELARANRVATVGAFSASIAHELNQPIASILIDSQTGLRLVGRERPDVETLSRILQRVEKNAQRVTGIVQRTRETIVAGRRSATAIDVFRLASDIRNLLEHDLKRASVELEIVCPDKLPTVMGDPIELQQVFVNLVTNAADAMRDQPGVRRIILEMLAEDDAVRVRVTDTGPGIPQENIDRLFEAFFTTKPTGIGMGLQICRTAVEAMGGQLTVSNVTGGGACFSFDLPIAVEDREPVT